MSTRTKKATEENVEEARPAAAEAVETVNGKPGEEKGSEQEKQIKEFLSKIPYPCVYCGPSVRGVVRQFTVYTVRIPDALKEFIMEHKAARGLLVSVDRFAQVRTRLETPGTGEFILFRKVRAEL